jgi:hypothetical protein
MKIIWWLIDHALDFLGSVAVATLLAIAVSWTP